MELKEHVAEIVSAYLRKNQVSADQLTATITAVHEALAGLGKPEEPVAPLTPQFLFGVAFGQMRSFAWNVVGQEKPYVAIWPLRTASPPRNIGPAGDCRPIIQ